MKLVIPCQLKNENAEIDSRFGRANYFLLVDTESDERNFIDNVQNLQSPSGAGIQSAQIVVNAGADAVLTGHCGPKAFRALCAAGIAVYTNVTGSVDDAVNDFKQGNLKKAEQADVQGHW